MLLTVFTRELNLDNIIHCQSLEKLTVAHLSNCMKKAIFHKRQKMMMLDDKIIMK